VAAFQDFYDFILPEVPLTTKEFVDFQMRRVLREFFRRTTCWRHTQAVALTDATTNPISLTVPDGIASHVLSVVLDGGQRPLPVLPEHMRLPVGATIDRGRPAAWYTIEADQLYLYPPPNGDFTLQISLVANMPRDPAFKTVPDFVLDHYHDVVAAGVIGELYSMAGKPWTQPDAGKLKNKSFYRGMQGIRASMRDGGQPNSSVFTGPRFGA
jgi:hypothetical protein